MVVRRKIVVVGIMPSNVMTVANYLTVVEGIKEIQKKNEAGFTFILLIADLHALSYTKNRHLIGEMTKKFAAFFYACELKNTHIIIQSWRAEHTLLAYLLLPFVHLGELERMIQYKEKVKKVDDESRTSRDGSKVNLLIYPVLMVADILLYGADFVIAGLDQVQHLELLRKVVRRLNRRKGDGIVKLPRRFSDSDIFSGKIMSLVNPLEKMSKSSKNSRSYVSVFDDYELILSKMKAAKTDSFNSIECLCSSSDGREGVNNLLFLHSLFSEKEIHLIENEYRKKKYLDLKKDIAKLIWKKICPIQKRWKELLMNEKEIYCLLQQDNQLLNGTIMKKIDFFKKKVIEEVDA